MAKAVSPNLSDYLYADEADCVDYLVSGIEWSPVRAANVEKQALDLVNKIRAHKRGAGQLESFLQQYSLSTEEGLALMCLAEALLRVPDPETANHLIQDKVAAANWLKDIGRTEDWVVKAAGVGLLMTKQTLNSALSRIGKPFVREAMVKAMRVLGRQFVLGIDIEDAIKKARPLEEDGYRMSYDMLGEGARTAADAEQYFASYETALKAIAGQKSQDKNQPPGLSVKLSALHPRYEYAQREKCVPALTERLLALCEYAARKDVALVVDAEEVDRLEISLEIIENVLKQPDLRGWGGFGLAVQAYQKRALPLLGKLSDLSRIHNRRLRVRLVKGAYWDTEIKRAQVEGLLDYPVFTRKSNTDLSYLACAYNMLSQPERFYPLLATHNAHTVCAVLDIAQEKGASFEFQKLFGMGDSLYTALKKTHDVNVSVYAPVGPHRDLLPYLVRRLLENGANSSFVNKVLDVDEPAENVVSDPVAEALSSQTKRHPKIRLPQELFQEEKPFGRRNSAGMDLTDDAIISRFLKNLRKYREAYEVGPLVNGKLLRETSVTDIENPADLNDQPGVCWSVDEAMINQSFEIARRGFQKWVMTPAQERASCLMKYADLLEKNRDELMAILIREAGKTIPDALAEIRETVDFARYYANKGRAAFARAGEDLPGPTGEQNILKLHGRGIFVCISPWNFPLAIFSGQVTAALMAGNSVIAKPAGLTPIIAMRAVQLMHEAGIPSNVINLLTGNGQMGGKMVAHPDVAGVAFTGSTETAWTINKTLAEKRGPIVPLIAETGGQNTMIVDSSALPEQVVDDVILSAFKSAGQRCSALRVLCLQEDIADTVITMLRGAMAELVIGNPGEISTDIGPVIDDKARRELIEHRNYLEGFTTKIYEVPLDDSVKSKGYFFTPCAYELDSLDKLRGEVFGPVLHIVRYKKSDLDDLITQINAQGYGLTLGVHSRIDAFHEKIEKSVRAGNVYINRSMIGAIVGSQPFGGQGLSGTGPKAGGPHYLHAFATEKAISIDTTAAGGNASLVSLEE